MPIQPAHRHAAPRPGNPVAPPRVPRSPIANAANTLDPEPLIRASARPASIRSHRSACATCGTSASTSRLEIVRAQPREKGRNFERFRISCQRVDAKISRVETATCGRDHDVPRGREIERGQDARRCPSRTRSVRGGRTARRRPAGAQAGPARCAAGARPKARSARSAWSPRRSCRRPGRRRSGSASRPDVDAGRDAALRRSQRIARRARRDPRPPARRGAASPGAPRRPRAARTRACRRGRSAGRRSAADGSRRRGDRRREGTGSASPGRPASFPGGAFMGLPTRARVRGTPLRHGGGSCHSSITSRMSRSPRVSRTRFGGRSSPPE